MLNKYTVSAQVDSEKFGKGQLVADLSQEDLVKYANLSDKDKLAFLKDHGAQLKVDLAEIEDKDVSNYQVEGQPLSQSNGQMPASQSTRKMRMNINGHDTGWIDVTEENEDQYNQMIEQFNDMHKQFNERFNHIFGKGFSNFLDFKPSNFLDQPKK